MKTIFKKSLLLTVIALLLMELFVPLLPSGKAQAAVITGAWVDGGTIIIGSASGPHATYTLDSASGDYVYKPKLPGSFNALPSTNVTVPSPLPANTCPNIISVNKVLVPANSTGTIVENHWVKISGRHPRYKCEAINGDKGQPIALTDADNASLAPGAGASATIKQGCTAQFDDVLTWILCPAVDLMSQIVNWIDHLITNQLNVKTDAIFCTSGPNQDTCTAYYNAWQSFRDIALGLMAIAGLVLIISQALGLEILDAYTIRKTLPRLLVAALAITLSWPLMKFLIQLSDDLGFGVRHLIYAPFSNLGDSVDLSFGSGITNQLFGALSSAGTIALVPAWIVAGGPGALLAFLGTAALAVGVAITVLILRQVAIILLMLLAPLALVAYILPNTQRVYRMWWESFSKALLMFPLIAAMIATGRVFSAVAIHNGGILNSIIGFAAYYAPYFMIPMTFRMAGSAVSAMGNFVNGRAQGGFDSLRNARKEERGKRIKAAQHNALYRGSLIPFTRPFARDKYGNRKKTSLGNVLNAIGNNTVDWKDGWRLATDKYGGKVGRAVMGRQARGLRARIGRETTEQTAEAAKRMGLRYHAGRALMGQHGYVYDQLKGKTATMPDGTQVDAQQALRDKFGLGKRDQQGHLSEAALQGWRGSESEKEHHELASIYDQGGKGAREAAGELRAKARELDDFKGPGNDETQRANLKYLGAMVAAQGGHLENHELRDYYNDMSVAGTPDEAKKQVEQLQDLAAPLRTSQKKGYGLGYRVNPETGIEEAYDVYDSPTGPEAQSSVGRVKSQDISGSKADDLVTQDGHLSGWAESIIAGASDYVHVDREVTDPITGKKRTIAWNTGVEKEGQAKKDALALQGEIQSIEGYSSGDQGVGGQIYRIMEETGIQSKYGGVKGTIDPKRQHEELRLQQPPEAPAPPDNPFRPGA
jgi:hypothetical protein